MNHEKTRLKDESLNKVARVVVTDVSLPICQIHRKLGSTN